MRVARVLQRDARRLVVAGLEYDELSENAGGGGPLSALGPIISIAYGAFTWIFAFPTVWFIIRGINRRRR